MNKFESRFKKSMWERHNEKTKEWPPSESLIKAIGFTDGRDAALDMGAGGLRDSRYLAEEGFKEVIALDSEPTVGGRALEDETIEVVVNSFEDFSFPKEKFDLVNAQFSLPFTDPDQFDRVFTAVKSSLKKGGIFVGQLLGDKDDWAKNKRTVFLSRGEIEEVIKGMTVLQLEEGEKDKETVLGNKKHWHIFDLILQRKED